TNALARTAPTRRRGGPLAASRRLDRVALRRASGEIPSYGRGPGSPKRTPRSAADRAPTHGGRRSMARVRAAGDALRQAPVAVAPVRERFLGAQGAELSRGLAHTERP